MLFESLSLKHLARPPAVEGIGAPPLLIMLHGVGSNEQDLFELAPQLDPRAYVLSLQAPYQLAPNQYGWYHIQFMPQGHEITPDQAEASRKKLVQFIDEAVEYYEADPKRTFLFGFSQGAIMSLALLLTEPHGLAGVIAVAGRVLPDLFRADSPLGNKLADTDVLTGRYLFLAHGTQDPIMPVAYGRQAENLLARSPVQMTYREYEMGHEINPKCLKEIQFWLESHLSGP